VIGCWYVSLIVSSSYTVAYRRRDSSCMIQIYACV